MGDKLRDAYQLRRIGPPSTLEGVKDVMRLYPGCSKFGRSFLNGAENEFYVDSAHMKSFISRRHTEIYIQENGDCLLVDLGMNGTYINDIRVDGKCTLRYGDMVTFGHKNGINIKPGIFVTQPTSEFQFIFERVRCPSEHLKEVVENNRNLRKCKTTDDVRLSREDSPTTAYSGFIGRRFHDSLSVEGDEIVEISLDSESVKESSVQEVIKVERDVIQDESNDADQDDECIIIDAVSSPNAPPKNTTVDVSYDVNVSRNGTESEIVNGESNSPIIPNFSSYKSDTPINNDKLLSLGRKIKLQLSAPFHRISIDSGKAQQATVPSSKPNSQTKTFSDNKKGETEPGGRPEKRRRLNSEKKEDDVVVWYEGETCAALDCQRPFSQKIAWVQCDSCDDWYHTACVGCNYKQVKNIHIAFQCGCL